MKVISKAEAKAAGLRRYFTDVPCVKAGHVCERFVRDGDCVGCALPRRKAAQAAKRLLDGKIPWSKDESERLARRKAALQRYVTKNKDALRAAQLKYAAAHPERRKEIRQRSQVKSRPARRINEHKRRARKSGGFVSKDIATRLLRLQKGKCAACGVSIKERYQIDHIEPLARNGAHDDSNIQLLCPTCNRRKADKDPIVWAASIGRLI